MLPNTQNTENPDQSETATVFITVVPMVTTVCMLFSK